MILCGRSLTRSKGYLGELFEAIKGTVSKSTCPCHKIVTKCCNNINVSWTNIAGKSREISKKYIIKMWLPDQIRLGEVISSSCLNTWKGVWPLYLVLGSVQTVRCAKSTSWGRSLGKCLKQTKKSLKWRRQSYILTFVTLTKWIFRIMFQNQRLKLP